MNRSALGFVALALCAAGVPAYAQGTQLNIAPGTRLRIVSPQIPQEHRVVTVVESSSDTLAFRSDNYPVTRRIAFSDITSIDQSLGRRTHRGRYAFRGFMIGAIGGAVLGAVAHQECEGFCVFDTSREGDAALVGLVFGGIGAGLGAIIGGFDRSEEWAKMPLASRVSIFPSSTGGRIRVSIPLGGPGTR